MKKTFSILLTALLALSALTLPMASCEKNEETTTAATTVDDTPKVPTTPKELYQFASNQYDEADNYRVNYKFSVTLSGLKELFISVPVKQQVSESRNGNNLTCKLTQGSETAEVSYINGVMYTVGSGVKSKATMTWDEFVKFSEYERPDVIEQLPESAFTHLTVNQSGEDQVLIFKLSTAEMGTVAGNLREFLQLGADSDSAQFEKGTYTVFINKDGQVYKTSLEMQLKVTYKYKECACYVVVETSIGYGSANVKAPKDADSYIDITGRLEIPA